MSKQIGIIGAGSWGLALAKLLFENEHDIILWTINERDIEEFKNERSINKYLKGITFDKSIKITNDKKLVVENKDIIITALPSSVTVNVLNDFKQYFKEGQVIVNVSKGFHKETKDRLSVAIKKVIPQCEVAVLSGPSHAEEVANKMYTAVVIATHNISLQKELSEVFTTEYFRIYGNTDIVGVEIGGALKNIIALAVGVSSGIGQGDNAMAALMTRSMEEVTKVGIKMGANPLTFIGLSGFGDLIVTCGSTHSRNRRAGDLLGKGYALDDVKKEVGMVIESFDCLLIVKELIEKYEIDAPIIESLYEIVFKGSKPHYVMKQLMQRSSKFEKFDSMFSF